MNPSVRRHRRLRNIIATLLIAGLAGAGGFGWLIAVVSHMEDTVAINSVDAGSPFGFMRKSYDCIIVLGAQVKPNGAPSEALLRRMTLALEYYKQQAALIILTGGQGQDEPVAEGDYMYSWMRGQGVPVDSLAVENTSVNTRENIANAKRIMDERGLARALVVTSDYHLPRALAVCGQLGVDAMGAGSQSSPEMWWKNHIRESLSWIKYKLGF